MGPWGEIVIQALAYCEAGAFLERMYQNTGSQGPHYQLPKRVISSIGLQSENCGYGHSIPGSLRPAV